MGLPPPHRIDHTPILIFANDDAWDHERIDKELVAIDAGDSAWDSKGDHPWSRYLGGFTRADLQPVREYLQAGRDPVQVTLRRLSLRDWTHNRALAATSLPAAELHAIRHGVLRVDGADLELGRGGSEDGPLTDDDLEALRSLVGEENFWTAGKFCRFISKELLDFEKKR